MTQLDRWELVARKIVEARGYVVARSYTHAKDHYAGASADAMCPSMWSATECQVTIARLPSGAIRISAPWSDAQRHAFAIGRKDWRLAR